jgi:hypothetical protein
VFKTKDWGITQVTNLAYVAEMQVTRKIESNDGYRIVALRTFKASCATKFRFDVEGVMIDLGMRGELVLGAIDYLQPGTTDLAPDDSVSTQKAMIDQFRPTYW